MDATEIFKLAFYNLDYIAPALLVFSGLIFADQIAEQLIRLVKRAAREFKL